MTQFYVNQRVCLIVQLERIDNDKRTAPPIGTQGTVLDAACVGPLFDDSVIVDFDEMALECDPAWLVPAPPSSLN